MSTTNHTPEQGERTAAQLINDLAGQTSQLVRQELALARIEMTEKGQRAGLGIGMFGAAGVIALFGVGGLVAAGIILLGTAIAPWLAAVIIGGGLILLAGMLGLVGRAKVSQAVPPVPKQALQTSRKNIETVRESAREGRHA